MSKRIITVWSITNAELQRLQKLASAAGDFEMAAIAELARVGEFDGDDWILDARERRRVSAMTQREALVRCVELMKELIKNSED